MRRRGVRRVRFAASGVCFALLATGAGAALAQELRIPADGRLRNLCTLYQSDVATNFAGMCSQRFPDTHRDWDQSLGRFNARNKAQLAELTALQTQVLSALRTVHPAPLDVDTWATVAGARLEQGALLAANMLASMNDADAQRYCEQVRKGDDEAVISEDDLKNARSAAAAAIEDLGKR